MCRIVGAISYLLDMIQTRSTDENGIARLPLHQAVMGDPTQRDLRHRQAGFIRCRFDDFQCLEVVLVPVAWKNSKIGHESTKSKGITVSYNSAKEIDR